MTKAKLLNFLEENEFVDLAKKNSIYFENIFRDCLNVTDEQVLLIGDLGTGEHPVSGILLGCYYFAAKTLNINFDVALQDSVKMDAPASKEIVDGLSSLPDNSVIILSLYNKLGSIRPLSGSYRNFVKKHGHRFVSSSSMGYLTLEHFDALISSINVDYEAMRKSALKLKGLFDAADVIRVTSDKGTDLTFKNIKGSCVCSDAFYTSPGTGGNIPAGEVYLPPVEGTANGKVIVDGSIRDLNRTTVVETPITFYIENGSVIKIEGEKASLMNRAFSDAEKLAKYPDRVRKFCELGIGINPGASIAGSTILDEKTLKTAHIAFGSNYWFGGSIRSIVHLDQVFKNPKIYLDGKLLKI